VNNYIHTASQAYDKAMFNNGRLSKKDIDEVIDNITADCYWAYNFALRYHQGKRLSKRQIKNIQVKMLSTCLAGEDIKENIIWYNMFRKHIYPNYFKEEADESKDQTR